jgi:adenosylcobinamide kinase/adenosylcobinamide-phosphate guanylyltransferase
MTLTLLTGGARSGKSAIAVRRAAALGAPVVFVATGEARDAEMAARIARHQAERPAGWTTVEAPHELADAVARQPASATLIVDCLSLWVSNLLEREDDEAAIVEQADQLARTCVERGDSEAFVVTNEVGSGLVPMHPLGRAYRDALGRVNLAVASRADLAQLVVAGRTLTLDPEPGAGPEEGHRP